MHRQRVLSALVFIPLFYLLVRYGSPDLFFFILSLSILLGLHEFFCLLEARGIRPLRPLGFVSGWTLSLLIYTSSSDRDDLLLFLALLVGGFLVALLSTKEDFGDRIQGAGATLLGILYLSLLLSFLALLRRVPGGETYIYYLFAVTWAGDAGAFYFGIRFGRHRLCPTLSPGKSVEGSIAGLVCSLAASFLAKWSFFSRLPSWHALVLGLLLGIAAQLGDLSESLLKRSLAVKDSGSLIPGHGGFLDRVDSLLFTGPFLYFYVSRCLS